MGYWGTYYADKGGFQIGDRVRIKPGYKGKTALSKAKRSGDWILKEFKTKNWVLKRPDDYTGYYKQGLLAKSHMLEKVELKAVGPTPKYPTPNSPTGLKPQDPPFQSVPPSIEIEIKDPEFVQKFVEEMTKDDPPNLKSVAKEKIESKSVVTLWGPNGETNPFAPKPTTPVAPITEQNKVEIGNVVIVKDPTGSIPKGKLFMVVATYGVTADIVQLFTGEKWAAMKTWLTVLPEKDLTITYLPK